MKCCAKRIFPHPVFVSLKVNLKNLGFLSFIDNQELVKACIKRYILLTAIFVPFFFSSPEASAQPKVKAPVKFKIEDGGFEESTVVIRNNTTGESNSIPGTSKFDLDLKPNCDYIISFQKPGYITKKIAFNTSAPAERVSQGFYPFTFEVNLFKQYDGVNIVVFNQPVGKIEFSRLIDDFDYDTDYTKQIQSALKLAEEEIKKKQTEERAQAAQQKKEEEKRKAEEAAKAREEARAKQEADRKAAEEARLQAAADARQKRLEEEEQRKKAKALEEEEKKRLAVAKMEEEERKRLAAAEEEERRRLASSGGGSENPSSSRSGASGDGRKASASTGGGSEMPGSGGNTANAARGGNRKATPGEGDESRPDNNPDAGSGAEKGVTKAIGISGEEERKPAGEEKKPTVNTSMTPSSAQAALPKTSSGEQKFEVLPDVSVEEISEPNRKITRVTVRKGEKETIFSKVVYNWGGVYYFKATTSISESLYFMNTGLR